MKRAFAIAVLAAPAAWAALPGLPADFTVRVVDESGRLVPGAIVIAREFVDVPQLHGSRTYCERGDVAQAASGESAMRLPGAGVSHLAPGRKHAMEAFAYVKGQCVQRTGSARVAARMLSVPFGIRSGELPRTIQAGEMVTLRSVPAAGAEERLEYLVNLSGALACESWSSRSQEPVARLASALRGEASLLPRESAYAKSLARRLDEQLTAVAKLDAAVTPMRPGVAVAAGMAPPRNFLVAPANARLHWPASDGGLVVMSAGRAGTAYAAAAMPAPPIAVASARTGRLEAATPSGTVIRAEPAPVTSNDTALTIHCRPGSACNLDERDAQGLTALYQYGEAYDLDRFRLLLDRGADPSVAVDRHGANAIDAVLRRAVMQPPALGSIDADKARAIIDLIAANPRAAIRASLAAQLKAEPTQWFVKSPEALAILVHAREKLAALPTRADGAGTCERIEAGAVYEPGALRLR